MWDKVLPFAKLSPEMAVKCGSDFQALENEKRCGACKRDGAVGAQAVEFPAFFLPPSWERQPPRVSPLRGSGTWARPPAAWAHGKAQAVSSSSLSHGSQSGGQACRPRPHSWEVI